jgi:hypothetical protein
VSILGLGYSAFGMLRSADRAYNRFTAIWQHVLESDPLEISVGRDLSNNSFVFTATKFPRSPVELGEEFQQIITALKSSLEHLATALAMSANGEAPLDDAVASKITFPIYDDAHKFKSKEGEIARYFRPGDWALIEQLQPFNGDAAYWGTGFVGWHPVPVGLYAIETYAKTLRHRQIEVVLHNIGFGNAPDEVHGVKTTGSVQAQPPFAAESVLGTWSMAGTLPDEDPPAADIQQVFRLVPTLADQFFHLPAAPYLDGVLIPNLDALLQTVLTVTSATIQLFVPSLKSGSAPLDISIIHEWGHLSMGY